MPGHRLQESVDSRVKVGLEKNTYIVYTFLGIFSLVRAVKCVSIRRTILLKK